MATVTPVYNWPVPTSTDYVKDGATSIEALGDAIDASLNTITGGKNVGLRLEQTYTLSSSSGISLSGLVVGGRYRISGIVTSTSSPSIIMRWRENSTDKATNYFWAHTSTNLAGSFVGGAGNPDTLHYLGNCFANSFSIFGSDIAICSATTGQAFGQYWDSVNGRQTATAMTNSNMTNLNGLSIFPTTGTITGNISIYRYA